ncbi:hypothetical protein [Prosthecobacter sp.]|uniref:hypothetical protein n=1 Tax=Prosthecobacter sp. TaxID=1965333 RepID=UPI001DA3A85D|nr:hypothetical protein [Prosthecobacter sp.]MCB1275051.1 hypothetical protein [Prosthecobacter sp.]
MPNRALGIKTTLPEGVTLKEGDEADLRVVVKDGVLVVTKVLRQSGAAEQSSDYKARLGTWNRK